MVTRFVNQIRILRNLQGVELHVAWLLPWRYRKDPASQLWVDDIRRDWNFPNVLVYALPLPGCRSIGRFVSGAYRLAFLASYILRYRIDVVLVHSFSGVPGGVLKLRGFLGVRCLFDMQGAVPEELAYQGKTIKVIRRIEVRERRVLSSCESVFCVSRALTEHMIRKHSVTPARLRVVPCCVPKILIGRDYERRERLRKMLGVSGKTVLVYSGGTDPYQCVEGMCTMVSQLMEKCGDVIWLILTWGDITLFRRYMSTHRIDESRCRFERLPQKQVHDYLTVGDVGLLLREDHVLNRVSSPTKFAEYLAAGVPVVTTPYVGDVSDGIMQRETGILVEPPPATDYEKLTIFVKRVKRNREAFASRCLEYAKCEWAWESYEGEFSRAVHGDTVVNSLEVISGDASK